jgi:cytidylate kinase
MPVITIRGRLGTGAPEIGKLVADTLHIDYVDREIIAQVAQRLKWSKERVEDKETPPHKLIKRVAEALSRAYPSGDYEAAYLPHHEIHLEDAKYLAALAAIVIELARNRSIVIMGRGSQFILKNSPEVLHVLIMAPLDVRKKRVMDALKLSENDANEEIAKVDSRLSAFIQRYFKANLDDSTNYDLIINTKNISFKAASSIIIKALRRPH